mmetsp:Transcript_1490/g.2948  ORF Transcript_1490/g.2948 Transcript_1490/m.2948 type:complete len:686 (+) Transcript_1490:182-2239(+)
MMQSSAAFFAAAIFLPSAATAPGIVINGEPERRALFGSLPTTSPPGECGLPEYTGATSTIMDCRNTYGTDSWYCPEDFPMFPTSSETSPNCELAVVGAGAGGLYSAMRLIDTGKMQGSDICIFEMTNRVAGRLYSLRGLGPNRDLSVDAGGYRTWPQFTPVLHALITEYLNIPMECYDPPPNASDPCAVFNIIDETGNKAGFATFVEVMMQKVVDAGARFFPSRALVSFEQTEMDGPKTLHLSYGMTATANKLLLNIPQRPLLTVLRESTMPDGAFTPTVWSALHTSQTEIVSKLYLYYENAWWYDLGLTSGDFDLPGDATQMPLSGRYHDGHVKCDEMGKCHGFLLATYINDYGGQTAMFFRRYQAERPEPTTIISSDDIEGRLFLEHAHGRLVEYHQYHSDRVPGYAANSIRNNPIPKFAVLSTWNIAVKFAGGGWHGWTNLAYVDEAMDPLGEYGVYTVNEAYSNLQGWAEGSLMAADEMLLKYYDCPDPWDFEVSPLVQVVRQTAERECTGGGDEDGGGTTVTVGGGDADVLCFTGDAKLQMANGTLVPLKSVRAGEMVWTGAAAGKVTEVLVHPVKEKLKVAVMATPHGELVGTPSHPIKVGGKWMEISAAHEAGLVENVKFEERFIDAFYNLEVDAHIPGKSEHAYVVNAVIASGLGDNVKLNTMMPRQNSWIAKTHTN